MWDILIADDHELLREGLKPFLRALGDDAVVLEAASYDEARSVAAKASGLGLIVVDIGMPGMNGLWGIGALHAEFPAVPLVVLSADFRQDTVAGAVQAGAAGFIPKTVSGALLVDALRQVLAGEMYRPESMMAEEDYDDYAVSPEPPCAPSPLDGLSDRERTLLALVVEGLTNKEIGRRVGLQEATIKAHLRVLYRRIGAINRAQAVRIALQS